MPTIGIIGAGISGLSAAHQLRKEGVSVEVLEASAQPGGVIQSSSIDGFLVEHGPNSIRAGSRSMERLIEDLGLQAERVWANEVADTRYVVRDGEPVALPSSIGAFLTTDLFSTRAKLRLLAEPFVGRARAAEESVAAFTQRRLGPEVLDYAVAPFVGGVFAGRPEELSVQHAFRRLAALEEEHGSLFLGGLRRLLSGGDGRDEVPSGLFSFRDGLQTLPNALSDALDDHLVLNAPVCALESNGGQWRVRIEPPTDDAYTRSFDALVSTVPLHRFGKLHVDTPVDLSPLRSVSYPPLSVLALGYPRDAVSHPLDGFGVLVPPVAEDFDILGSIFSSTLFPNRAPDDQVLLTTFVGGARAPEQATPDTATVQSLVADNLHRLLGVTGAPTFRRHIHWPNAIPQYTVGYGEIKATLDRLEEHHPRLAFAGNYRQGVSVGDALASGVEAAGRLLDRLGTSAS